MNNLGGVTIHKKNGPWLTLGSFAVGMLVLTLLVAIGSVLFVTVVSGTNIDGNGTSPLWGRFLFALDFNSFFIEPIVTFLVLIVITLCKEPHFFQKVYFNKKDKN